MGETVRSLNRIRPRLLVVSKQPSLRNDLVTLLTGYNYYVDYAETRQDGVRRFRHHKHVVVILDVDALPSSPHRLFAVFKAYRENPIILIAARREEEDRVYPFLEAGCFDILEVPLRVEYLHHKLRRVVQFHENMVQNQYHRILLLALAFSAPVWLLLIVLLAIGRG